MEKEFFQIRMPKAEKQELHEIAAKLPESSASQIAREAIREKVAKIKKELGIDAPAEVSAN